MERPKLSPRSKKCVAEMRARRRKMVRTRYGLWAPPPLSTACHSCKKALVNDAKLPKDDKRLSIRCAWCYRAFCPKCAANHFKPNHLPIGKVMMKRVSVWGVVQKRSTGDVVLSVSEEKKDVENSLWQLAHGIGQKRTTKRKPTKRPTYW